MTLGGLSAKVSPLKDDGLERGPLSSIDYQNHHFCRSLVQDPLKVTDHPNPKPELATGAIGGLFGLQPIGGWGVCGIEDAAINLNQTGSAAILLLQQIRRSIFWLSLE